ncbi:MAG TPA: hypothetical protein VG408_02340 [Actinomycetota bacterium]|nr:hypothetical protein [Actinomycetota bacterium]
MSSIARLSTCLALVAVSCRPDTIELSYRFEEGRVLHYEMNAHAEARWDIRGPGEGSYDVSFEVIETVRSVDANGALVLVEMRPLPAEERGLPSPGLESRSFSLRLGDDGEVIDVLDLDGVAASALSNEEIAFIGTYRPALPTERVRLDDSWRAPQEIAAGPTFQQLDMSGRLASFARDERGRLATMTFDGSGPVRWETILPQGAATLEGTADSSGSALFDIDGGYLRSGDSTTIGDFQVRVLPGGGRAPISGTLHLELELTIAQTKTAVV